MSVITKSAFDSSKFKHKIKSGPPSSHQSTRGPIKASYEMPNRQWQVKYQYNSPSKTVQNNGHHKSGKKTGKGTAMVTEESSEYGTMDNPDNPGAVPLLNIEDNSCFNDVTIEERRERIGSILDEILSIPRLAEANITKRSLSRSSMARFTGGGSVRSGSSQMNNGSRASNFSRYSSQDRKSALVRSVSSPKITTTSSKPAKNIDTKKKEINSNLNRRSVMMSRSTSHVGKSTQKKTASEVPKLNLALDVTSRSQLPGFGGQRPRRLEDDELSAEFLPSHNTSNMRPTLGNVTQAELAINVPSLGDDTIINLNDESDTFEMEKSNDFVRANMKISPKKINSGRTSAASTVITAKHRTGSVPK